MTTSNTIEQEYARHDYGIIDYGTCQGRKIYNRATSELNEIKYRCNLKDLSTLINDLSNQAFALGWTKHFGIFHVPHDDNNLQGDYYNFLNEYESIEFYKLCRFASRITTTMTRLSQDLELLYQFLLNSLSPDALNVITTMESEYMIDNTPFGILLLGVIIRESYVNYIQRFPTSLISSSSLSFNQEQTIDHLPPLMLKNDGVNCETVKRV